MGRDVRANVRQSNYLPLQKEPLQKKTIILLIYTFLKEHNNEQYSRKSEVYKDP